MSLHAQAAVLAAAATIPIVALGAWRGGALQMAQALQLLSGLAFAAGGVALLVSWKLSGRAAPGWAGAAFAALGALSVCERALAGLGLSPTGHADPLGGLLIDLVAASGLVVAVRSPQVDARLRPIRALAVVGFAGFCALVVLDRLPSALLGAAGTEVTGATRGAVWLVAATAVLTASRRRRGDAWPWLATVLLLVGAGRLTSAFVVTPGGLVAANVVTLTAAALAVTASAWELHAMVRGQDRYALQMRSVLDGMKDEMEHERADLEERLHDLRNAVAALRTADTTLRRLSSRLDEKTKADLADALTAELSRLQALIEPGRRTRVADFDLAAALAPVLDTERMGATTLRADVPHLGVRGDPEAIAQVVQNLLTNARRYAPGSLVTVTARSLAGRVELRVADEGPGIPESERLSIFGRGVRGSTAAGTTGLGIGLFLASRLVADMGGSLRLDPASSGATFVVELPGGAPVPGRTGVAGAAGAKGGAGGGRAPLWPAQRAG